MNDDELWMEINARGRVIAEQAQRIDKLVSIIDRAMDMLCSDYPESVVDGAIEILEEYVEDK